MTKDTLSTLDLTEKPGQKITWFHHVRHFQEDTIVVPVKDDHIFSPGPHHGHYSYTIASARNPYFGSSLEEFLEAEGLI